MNVVGTVLLTGVENPMCPGCDNYKPEPRIFHDWAMSLRDCQGVLLHDELQPFDYVEVAGWTPEVPLQLVQVETDDINLFFQRWLALGEWLNAHNEVEKVFFTDCSDVRMLRAPWPQMVPGTLYVGSEEDTISNKWIIDHHPTIRPMASLFPYLPLLNPGLLGGTRMTVLEFLSDFVGYGPHSTDDMTDMAAFNLCLRRERWCEEFVTGYPVHTKFNSWVESDPKAWWAHK